MRAIDKVELWESLIHDLFRGVRIMTCIDICDALIEKQLVTPTIASVG